MVDEGDEDGVHAFGIAAGEESIGVVGVDGQLGVGELLDLVGKGLDAVAGGFGDVDFALDGEETVVGVVGGVEEILVVEFAEDDRGEDVVPGHGVGGVLLGDLFLNFEGGIEVEVVEVEHGLLELGLEIEEVGMEGGSLGVGG